MASSDLAFRIRRTIDDYFVLFVALFLVCVLLGGWLTYTVHVDPSTQTDEQVISSWSETGTFTHSATVREDNEVFSEGTELTDKPRYFTTVSPELEGEFVYLYRANRGDLDVHTDAELVIRSVDVEENEYWRVSDSVESSTIEGLTPGAAVRTTFSINVSEVEERIDRIEDELGASPGTIDVRIVAVTTVSGTIDGVSVEEIRDDSLVVKPEGGTYEVTDESVGKLDHRATKAVAVPAEYGPIRTVGSPMVLAIGFVGSVGLLIGRRREAIAPKGERSVLFEHRKERKEFDEWITPGSPPETLFSEPVVQVETLVGLVDLAIDSDRRVIEDPDTRCYYVIEPGLVFTYEPSWSVDGGTFLGNVHPESSVETDTSSSAEGNGRDDEGRNRESTVDDEASSKASEVPTPEQS